MTTEKIHFIVKILLTFSRYRYIILLENMKGEKIMSAFKGLLSLHEAALIWNIDDSTIRKAIEFGFI